MALQLNITLKDNFSIDQNFPSAYIKVNEVEGNKEAVIVTIGYFDKKDGMLLKTKQVDFVPDMDGPNFIKQAYLHLKTLSEFSNAQDA
jgi:hypothetical protein